MKKETYTIDASNQAIGRLASKVAMVLMGKHKATFEPNKVSDDVCEVINVSQMKATGKKMVQKKYFRVSQHPGGIKSVQLDKLMKEKPGEVLKKAVYNMLPENRLRKERMKRLIVK